MPAPSARADTDTAMDRPASVDLQAIVRESNVHEVLEQLDRELVGLAPVKRRLREIAAFLAVTRARGQLGLEASAPSLHMSFTGNPGTGKTTVALRIAQILHRLGYVRKGHVVSATRDDLVGQYIGHTAPKTKEVLKKAMGGVLFIDEAYYLYRPENERDYGQEAIEILLQVTNCSRSPNRWRAAGTTASTTPRAWRCASTSPRACASRTSPTHARCATRSTAHGCARPIGCSTPAAAPMHWRCKH
jgi:hypothetical protein